MATRTWLCCVWCSLSARFSRSATRETCSEEQTLSEVMDRGLNKTFCLAANSLSNLYAQALDQQKEMFEAGERHSLEKLMGWITLKVQEGAEATPEGIRKYLKAELDCETTAEAKPSHPTQSIIFPPPMPEQAFFQAIGAPGPSRSNKEGGFRMRDIEINEVPLSTEDIPCEQ